jgi:endogenous inhibitor of DNA gyrase (YacG/DUF329 family)
MSKQLTCPRCERPTVKEDNLSYSKLGRVRECMTCGKSSVWLALNSYTKADYKHQDEEWKSWQAFSGEASKALFENNQMGVKNV